MAFGTLSGVTKEWSQKEIDDAKQAGLFFKPVTNTTASKTATTVPTTSNSFTPLGQTSNFNYNYANGSAQGPATYQQAYTPNGQGTVSIAPAKSPSNWYLSSWSSSVDKWTTQPTLTIDGKQFKYNTPTEYITALSDLKSKGSTGELDLFIKQLQDANKNWVPMQTQDAMKLTQNNQQLQNSGQPKEDIPKTTNNQVIDYNQLSDVVSKRILENLPQLTQYKPYQSQYNDALMETLNKIQNYKAFDFNENNPALKQAQDSAMGRVRQDMAKRGRVFDTYADVKLQEAAQGLIPTYYQLEQNQYNKDRANIYDILTSINNADITAYNRYNQNYLYNRADEIDKQDNYLKALEYGDKQAQTQFNRDVQSAPYTGKFQGQNTIDYEKTLRDNKISDDDKARTQEIQEFGVPLSPVMRQFRQVFQSMPQNVSTQIIQLGNQNGGFAAEINKRTQSNPNDPLIPYLQAARAMKVLSDPELLQQYGSEYGMQSTQINQQAKTIVQKEVINKLDILKKSLENEKSKQDIEKIKAEVRKNNSDAAMKELEASYLPQKLKAEIALELEKVNTEKAQQGTYTAQAAYNYSGVNLRNSQSKAADANAAESLAGANLKNIQSNASTAAGAAYQEFLSSNMKPEDWLKTDSNAEALGKSGALKEFIGILKSTGKFGTNKSLDDLLAGLE